MKPTPIEKLRRNKDVLASPFERLGDIKFSSWINEVLPDALWSVLIAGLLPREKALSAFRVFLTALKSYSSKLETPFMPVHSQFAKLSDEVMDKLFSTLCQDNETRKALSLTLLLDTVPDRHHWVRLCGNEVLPEQDFGSLAEAVANCFDHQSQAATDCRWVRVMTLLAQDRLFVQPSMAEMIEEFIFYPKRGDMRQVRPRIRSMEMMTRNPDIIKDAPTAWTEEFWNECWRKTHCIPSHRDENATQTDYSGLFEEIVTLDQHLMAHFIDTIKTTNIDPRHDGAFGLCFYILHLLVFSLKGAVGQALPSRSILRTAVECYITLCFLASKDDETIWLQYRNYGNGQVKLAYLKNLSAADIPSFLTLELLETLANEDMWLEFQDIKLGAWADKNLRKMAEEAGVKDIYDRYYDAVSGYVHGNWIAVRHSVFGECLNPLHRFHRIPLPPRILSEDAVPDIVKILNLSLDKLASLYPSFKPRLHLKTKMKAESV